MVILIYPNINPDGRDRHSNWANMHKVSPPVSDPQRQYLQYYSTIHNNPLIGGYLHASTLKKIKGNAAIVVGAR